MHTSVKEYSTVGKSVEKFVTYIRKHGQKRHVVLVKQTKALPPAHPQVNDKLARYTGLSYYLSWSKLDSLACIDMRVMRSVRGID